MFRFGYCNIF